MSTSTPQRAPRSGADRIESARHTAQSRVALQAVTAPGPREGDGVSERISAVERFVRLRAQLDSAIARRAALSSAGDVSGGESRASLERTVAVLWQELRAARAEVVHESRERILARARAEARFDSVRW